jgi:mannitol 2-dehydrogenase
VIVHLGLGAFSRSHLASYVDALTGADADGWSICGVGFFPADKAIGVALADAGFAYTLTLRHPDGALEPRTITSVTDYLFAPDDEAAVVDRMADPATRIVSLTITEGGYEPSSPDTAFRLACAALARRRASGEVPFTVLCCDNIQHNGDVARRAFVRYAESVDPGLAQWIRDRVAFPSSMVDRITPAVLDPLQVFAEPFTQWVLEDTFTAGRPAWETVGAQLVDDVEPYELMKLRLLNAGHQAIAYVGSLLGHQFVHEAAGDPQIKALLRGYLAEALPTLRPVPGVDLAAYQESLVERFGNPGVQDTVARLAAFGSDRIPTFVLPAVRENLAAGRSVDVAAFVVATWAVFALGDGVVDNRLAQVRRLARADRFLDDVELFGALVSTPFGASFQRSLDAIRALGVRAALESFVV